MPFVIFINIIRIIFKYVLKFINYTGLLIIINIFYNYCYIKRKLEDDNNLDHSNTKRKLNQDNSDSELGSEQNSNSELEKSNSEAESELDSNARAELGSELESESESESKSESGLESKDSDSCPDLGHSSNETAEDDIGLTSGSDNPSPVE